MVNKKVMMYKQIENRDIKHLKKGYHLFVDKVMDFDCGAISIECDDCAVRLICDIHCVISFLKLDFLQKRVA